MTDPKGREVDCLCRIRIHWMKTSFVMVMAFVPKSLHDFQVSRTAAEGGPAGQSVKRPAR